jgi:aminotransferase
VVCYGRQENPFAGWVCMRDHSVSFEFEPPALRQVGTAVARVNGINLAQGLCLLPVPEVVIEGAERAMRSGENRYSLAQGVSELRDALSERLRRRNRIDCTSETVLVTSGSTGAFEIVCEAFLRPGDEVINFIPFYPYHRNTLKRRGAVVRYVPLRAPTWEFSIEEIRAAITPKTKFILITNPGNPTGKVFSRAELEAIATVAREADILVVTDEVYEYLTYDGRTHVSVASLPDMECRTITMGSYSKTFAITGWRIGYLVAPPQYVDLLRTIGDQMFVCPPTPLQHGVAHGIASLGDAFYAEQLAKYTRKRAVLCDALQKVGLTPNVPQGAYYVIADISARFPGKTSAEVVEMMIERARIAAVPASDFLGPEVKNDPSRSTFVRFSYSVPDEVLETAAHQLALL